MKAVLWLAVLVLLPAGAARAQISNAGKIVGTVVDPSGKVIPGADVTATEPSTGFTLTVKTNASGAYIFPALERGTYEIEAKAQGFATAVYHSVVVSVAQTTNLQIKMSIGTSSQTVTVSAQAQVLQTTQNTLATTISPTMIDNLPLNGRDLSEFASIVPGAANPGIGGTRYTTYDGQPNAAVNISVNGTNDQFLRYKTFSSSFYPPAPIREGAFSEATVSTSGLGSASGAEGASQIQFATQRGTSQFHGRAFWQAVNSFFNANTFINNARGRPMPKTRSNYFGGNIGGPLWPKSFLPNHRAYFFANLEYNSSPGSSYPLNNVLTSDATNGLYTYNVTSIPGSTPAWVTGCSATAMTCTANLYTLAQNHGYPSTADGTVTNILTGPTGISSYYSKGTLVPLGSTPSELYSANAQYLQQLQWSRPSTYVQWFPTTRFDLDITPKVHWSDSWDLWWRKINTKPNWPGSSYIGNYSGFKSTYYTWSNSVEWTISPTVINTASFGIMSDVEEFDPGADATAFNNFKVDGQPSQVSLPFGIPTLIPNNTIPIPRNNPLFNPSDTLRWTHGNHSFYIGGSLIYANMYELQVGYPPVPNYQTAIATGDPASSMFALSNFPNMDTSQSPVTGLTDQVAAEDLYALLTGRISSVGGTNYLNTATGQFQPGVGLRAQEAKTYGGVFFQDEWRTTPHFTLNYGFRWELTGAIHNTNDTYFAPTYANLLGPSGGLFQPGQLTGALNPYIGLNPAPYHGDFVQPAPNLGFAWNPDFTNGFLSKVFGGNKTVIRASFSINPFDEGWETFENATIYTDPGNFQVLSYASAAGQFTPGSETLSTPGVYNNVVATATPPVFQSAVPLSEFTFKYYNIATVDPNLKSPYVEQWNFGIQRQLPGNFVVELDYVGNHAVHIWQNFNLNEINATSNGFLADFKNAVNNYNINSSNGVESFADNTGFTGIVPTPVFDAAFSGNGVTTGASDPNGYGNAYPFIYDLQTGQAGAMASTIAGTQSYLCNMVGANFSPCGNVGGNYPINYFEANPYIAGSQLIYLSDPSSSTYNGLQVSVRHPVGHGLALGANYSISHSLTGRYLSYYTDTGQASFISLRDMHLNKAPSPFDIHQVFHVYFTYALPFGKGQAFDLNNSILNHIVGGWNVGAIISAQSGLPFWLQGGYNTFNDQDGGVVLNGVSASTIQNNIGVYTTANPFAPVYWLNPKFNASSIQPNTTPGTIGQMLYLHGPMFTNTDISLNKTIPIHERVNLIIQASFLNAFNHPNWLVGSYGAPGYIAYAAYSLGQPTASLTGSPRVIQWRTQIQF